MSYYTVIVLAGVHYFGVLFPKLQTICWIFLLLPIDYSLYEKKVARSFWLFVYFRSYNSKSKLSFLPSQHGCISDVSLRRLIQRLRDIAKRADWQISETSPGRLIRDVLSERSLRSLRFSQRRLWAASETVTLGLETKGSFWLPAHQSMSL